MRSLRTRCDFCNQPVDERGKRTNSNALCFEHLLKATSIPKKSGKKSRGTIPIVSDGIHLPRLSHKFSGAMGFDNGNGRGY